MKQLFFSVSFLTLFFSLGQELHSPAEIFKIMEKSKISYEINISTEKIILENHGEKVNVNDYYQIIDENGELSAKQYEVNEKLEPTLKKAEEAFQGKDISKARQMYLKALEMDRSQYYLITYVGQTYEIEENWDEAIKWYKKAIAKNYIDYMAHWFLADIYRRKKEIDKAVSEITIAKILNRNNPRISQSLAAIYKLKKLRYDEWIFSPEMRIDSLAPKKVSIISTTPWFSYAITKAVWAYEPNYRKSMGEESSFLCTKEEKEAFVSILSATDKKHLKKVPEFKALKLALDGQMIDEYIFYEVFLVNYPIVAYYLSEDFIKNMSNYIIEVRGKNKFKI